MPLSRRHLAAAVVTLFAAGAAAAQPPSGDKPARKRVLLVTHSGGFIHPSVATAEDELKSIGPGNALEVTCWRFTGDPAARVTVKEKGEPDRETNALEAYSRRFREVTGRPVEPEHCGRINKQTLKDFDVVFFFTTGDPVNKEELADLLAWVKAGGAFVGTHCATDTLYKDAAYGDMIGAYFEGHPPGLQNITVKVEDPKHPAAKGFTDGQPYTDEIYVFRKAPYSRDKLHVILSAAGFDPNEKRDPKRDRDLARPDNDYAVAWCRDYGKGKVFYTSLGHQPKVWKDGAFQQHLLAGVHWAVGALPGDGTPTGAKK